MMKSICLGLILGFMHGMSPTANAAMTDTDQYCQGGKLGYWSPSKNTCMKCDTGLYWDETNSRCMGNCSYQTYKKTYNATTGSCVCAPCNSEENQNPTTCVCTPINLNPTCPSGTIWDATISKCKPTCNTLWQVYDATTNTCVAKGFEPPPEPVIPADNPITPKTTKKYKNDNLHKCLVGAQDPLIPKLSEFDCVPTPQNQDGSLTNAADKDYTKWSDELYPGKSRTKPVNGFYSKKLVRCDNVTAPSEQCPIAVKVKFVITCSEKGNTWNKALGKCTIAQKIRTFYATYQAFLIPGQKPIKPNIVADSTISNTPATSITVESIVGAGAP